MNNKSSKKVLIITITTAIVALALAAVALFLVLNTDSNKLKKHLNLGQKYLEEGNYEEAIAEFDKALDIDPMNVSAYMGKAEAYEKQGEYSTEYEILTEIKELLEEEGEDDTREYKKVIRKLEKIEDQVDSLEGSPVEPGDDTEKAEGMSDPDTFTTDEAPSVVLSVKISWNANALSEPDMAEVGIYFNGMDDMNCEVYGETCFYYDERGTEIASVTLPPAGATYNYAYIDIYEWKADRDFHIEWSPGPSANDMMPPDPVFKLYKDGKLIDTLDDYYLHRYTSYTGAWVKSIGITENGFVAHDPDESAYLEGNQGPWD